MLPAGRGEALQVHSAVKVAGRWAGSWGGGSPGIQRRPKMALKERQQLGVEPALPVEVVPGTDPQAGAATQRQCVLVEVKDAAEMGVIPATDQEQRPGQQGRLGPMPNPAPATMPPLRRCSQEEEECQEESHI